MLTLVRQALTVADHERLRRGREETLRETTAQMETFLGIAGHELKNPLATMKLCLQAAEGRIQSRARRTADPVAEAERLLEPLSEAERQEERLDRLVNDLLDVSRVQAGKLNLHLAPTDLAAIVREVVEELRLVYPERQLLLVLTLVRQALTVADHERLRRGREETLRETTAQVRDAGPGIPAKEQERIWERFHRAQGIEVQSGTGVGLGLGLHISRTIIEQHQGQVGVQSAPGQGSTFWFSLPLAPPEPVLGKCEADTEEDPPEGSSRDGRQQS